MTVPIKRIGLLGIPEVGCILRRLYVRYIRDSWCKSGLFYSSKGEVPETHRGISNYFTLAIWTLDHFPGRLSAWILVKFLLHVCYTLYTNLPINVPWFVTLYANDTHFQSCGTHAQIENYLGRRWTDIHATRIASTRVFLLRGDVTQSIVVVANSQQCNQHQ